MCEYCNLSGGYVQVIVFDWLIDDWMDGWMDGLMDWSFSYRAILCFRQHTLHCSYDNEICIHTDCSFTQCILNVHRSGVITAQSSCERAVVFVWN